jgi:hypothetical protein
MLLALRRDCRPGESFDYTNGLQQVGRGGSGAEQAITFCEHGSHLQIDARKARAELPFQPPGRGYRRWKRFFRAWYRR